MDKRLAADDAAIRYLLGEMTEAEVRVVWPDGVADEWLGVAGDNAYVLERDKPVLLWPMK